MTQEQISWKDAERVVRLHRQMTGQPGQVSLSSLARSLGRTEDEVRSMVQQIRGVPYLGRRRFADPGGWLSAGLAAVAVGVLLAFGVFGAVRHALHRAATHSMASVEAPGRHVAHDIARIDTPDGPFNVQIELPPTPPVPHTRA